MSGGGVDIVCVVIVVVEYSLFHVAVRGVWCRQLMEWVVGVLCLLPELRCVQLHVRFEREDASFFV